VIPYATSRASGGGVGSVSDAPTTCAGEPYNRAFFVLFNNSRIPNLHLAVFLLSFVACMHGKWDASARSRENILVRSAFGVICAIV
jgi:hypothetical protein